MAPSLSTNMISTSPLVINMEPIQSTRLSFSSEGLSGSTVRKPPTAIRAAIPAETKKTDRHVCLYAIASASHPYSNHPADSLCQFHDNSTYCRSEYGSCIPIDGKRSSRRFRINDIECTYRSALLLRKWQKRLIGPEKEGKLRPKFQSSYFQKKVSFFFFFFFAIQQIGENSRTAAGMMAAPPIPWSARRMFSVTLSVMM